MSVEEEKQTIVDSIMEGGELPERLRKRQSDAYHSQYQYESVVRDGPPHGGIESMGYDAELDLRAANTIENMYMLLMYLEEKLISVLGTPATEGFYEWKKKEEERQRLVDEHFETKA